MAQVLQSQLTCSGGVDLLLVADSSRWAVLCCLLSGGQVFIGPYQSFSGGVGAVLVNTNAGIKLIYRRVGQLVTNEIYITGIAGSVVSVTEIVL